MARRRRFLPPSEQEIAIARRLRAVRDEKHLPRKVVAGLTGMSPQQLNRVERGTVSLRFEPGWHFCEKTHANPLWLAFGERYPSTGFHAFQELFQPNAIFGWWKQLSWQERQEPFLKVMIKSRAEEVYEQHKLKLPKSQPEENLIGRAEGEELKKLAEIEVKRYLALRMIAPANWKELRARLAAVTTAPGARAALARSFGVTRSAVSQWLSGASAPKADMALRLFRWVVDKEAQQNKSAGSAVTRPARETRKSRSTEYEKAKSSQRKC